MKIYDLTVEQWYRKQLAHIAKPGVPVSMRSLMKNYGYDEKNVSASSKIVQALCATLEYH